MVFNVFDSFLQLLPSPRYNLGKATLDNHLVSEGFSPEEASSVAWIINHRAAGEGYGFLGGFFAAYAFRNQFKKLQLK